MSSLTICQSSLCHIHAIHVHWSIHLHLWCSFYVSLYNLDLRRHYKKFSLSHHLIDLREQNMFMSWKIRKVKRIPPFQYFNPHAGVNKKKLFLKKMCSPIKIVSFVCFRHSEADSLTRLLNSKTIPSLGSKSPKETPLLESKNVATSIVFTILLNLAREYRSNFSDLIQRNRVGA